MFTSTGPFADITHSTRLNAQEQRELQVRIEKKQMKEFMNVSLRLLFPLRYARAGTLYSTLSSVLLIMWN